MGDRSSQGSTVGSTPNPINNQIGLWEASLPENEPENGQDHFTVYEAASEFAITVNKASTVHQIKQKIEEARNIPVSQQDITFMATGSCPLDTSQAPASVYGSQILLNRINEGASTSAARQAVFPCAFTVIYARGDFQLTVHSSLRVREIKDIIEENLHIPAANQILMPLLTNGILRDDDSVSPYTVGANLKLVLDPLKELTPPLNLQITLMKVSDLLVDIAADFSVGYLKKRLMARKDMAGVDCILVYANNVQLEDRQTLKDSGSTELVVYFGSSSAQSQKLSISVVHRSGLTTDTYTVEVDTNQTLWDVRSKLANDIVFPKYHFFIHQDGRVMGDGDTFGDFGVKTGDILYLKG